MPFGARASSCFMQRVANFVTRILRDEGIRATIYLDDIVVIAPDAHTARTHYTKVKDLLAELGLPEALDKAQPPDTQVRWLGIDIDAPSMSLSIPPDKVQDALHAVNTHANAKSINKRQLQSLIGKLMHVAKCVDPGRVFNSRLLEALRAFGDRHFIKVTDNMKKDLAWFQEFLVPWKGLSLIPKSTPHKVIQVDACLTGIGATDGRAAYAARVTPDDNPVANITEMEAVNVIIALHTFVTEHDAGGHILVQCDNLPVVQVLTTGRAHNPLLAECARAAWMIQAKFAIKLTFSHIAGAKNQVADALSRAHMTKAYHALAKEFIDNLSLVVVYPCTHIMSNLYPPLKSGSGFELASGAGRGQTGTGTSTWDTSCSPDHSRGNAHILSTVQHRADGHDGDSSVHMARVSRQQGSLASHHKKQTLPRPRWWAVHSPASYTSG